MALREWLSALADLIPRFLKELESIFTVADDTTLLA